MRDEGPNRWSALGRAVPFLMSAVLMGVGCHKKRGHVASATDHARRAEHALASGDTEGAAEALRAAVRMEPRNATWANELGLVLWYRAMETGDDSFRQEAMQAFQKACAAQPNWATCWVNRGNLAWASGDWGQAARYYEKALGANPKHPDAEAMRARIRLARAQALSLDRAEPDGGISSDAHKTQGKQSRRHP